MPLPTNRNAAKTIQCQESTGYTEFLFIFLSQILFAKYHHITWSIRYMLGLAFPVSNIPSHTHPFNVPFLGLPGWAGTRKVKTNVDFTEARDSEWQWHQLGHMQVCTSLQTDNHASTPPLSFLQAGCPSCHQTNSVKALKESSNIPSQSSKQ